MPAFLFFYLICSLRKIIDHEVKNLKSIFELFGKCEFLFFFGTYFAIIGNLYSEIAYSEYKSEVLLYPFTISPALSLLSMAWLFLAIGYIGYLSLRSCSGQRTLWRTNGWSSLLVFLVLAVILYFFFLEILWPQKSRSLLFMTFIALMINIICICNQVFYIAVRESEKKEGGFTRLRDEQIAEGETPDIRIEWEWYVSSYFYFLITVFKYFKLSSSCSSGYFLLFWKVNDEKIIKFQFLNVVRKSSRCIFQYPGSRQKSQWVLPS